jgi:hypothetical protein
MRITYRAAQPADRSFIAASWSTSCSRPPAAGLVDPAAWRTAVWSSVPAILDRPGVRALVAADPTETDRVADLFGFLVWEPDAVTMTVDRRSQQPVYRRAAGEKSSALPLVWYCYVKHGYRYDRASMHNARIASGLFARAGIDQRAPFPFVCHTRFVDRLRDAGKVAAAQWRPELALDNPRKES